VKTRARWWLIASVIVAASAPHRAEAFAGARQIIDQVKALADNSRLWMMIGDLLRDPDNALPAGLRVSIISVGQALPGVDTPHRAREMPDAPVPLGDQVPPEDVSARLIVHVQVVGALQHPDPVDRHEVRVVP